jgi:AcrR family transcriptional regulator
MSPHGAGTEPAGIRPGKRARNRATIEADIVRVGREHLAAQGAAALSLRAIARDLGMVSSGIYRYVDSRDELLTRLIVHAYTSLADRVALAHAAVDPTDLDARWAAVGHALRAWALEHPHDFALIYGSPVPDYEAPAERTSGPGTAVLAILVQLLADAVAAGRLASPVAPLASASDPKADAKRAVGWMLDDEMFTGLALTPDALMSGLAAWTLLLGTVTSEVFEQLGRDELADPEAYFAVMLATAGRLLLSPG